MLSEAPWTKFYGEVPATLTYPDFTLAEAVLDAAAKYPAHTAYSIFGRKTSYARLARNIKRAALSLRALGLMPGDRIMLCMPNMPQAVECFYAAGLIGAVAVMAHPLSSEGELEAAIKSSSCRAVVTLDGFADKFSAIMPEFLIVADIGGALGVFKRAALSVKSPKRAIPAAAIRWREFLRLGGEGEITPCKFAPDAPAVILCSGGTTGTAKGVLLSNRCFSALAVQTLAMSNCLNAGDRMLALMPIFHGFGLGVCIHMALTAGMELILISRFDAAGFAKIIKKEKPNCIVGVPTLFEALIGCDTLTGTSLAFLKGVFCGGDSLPAELKKRCDSFLHEHGAAVNIREGYGLTECVAPSCLTPYNIEKEGSIGLPFPDTLFKIVEEGGFDALPAGEAGEICISGPTVMLGYENNPEETREALKTHPDGRVWLHTGDLGSMDEDGFVYFKQRIKRMIISSGYSIYPSQLEAVISAFPGVRTSCVVGVPDPYRIRRPKAFVVPEDGVAPTEEFISELKAYCARNIAKYALPKEFEFRASLPLTKLGKIAYKTLEDENNGGTC